MYHFYCMPYSELFVHTFSRTKLTQKDTHAHAHTHTYIYTHTHG